MTNRSSCAPEGGFGRVKRKKEMNCNAQKLVEDEGKVILAGTCD
jgi:hypothetical protein